MIEIKLKCSVCKQPKEKLYQQKTCDECLKKEFKKLIPVINEVRK